MNLTEVRNVVPATLRDELDALWADYALTHEGAGVETFVAWLRDTSKIPEHVFREIHAAGRLDLRGPDHGPARPPEHRPGLPVHGG
jgi:hypothetical protein